VVSRVILSVLSFSVVNFSTQRHKEKEVAHVQEKVTEDTYDVSNYTQCSQFLGGEFFTPTKKKKQKQTLIKS